MLAYFDEEITAKKSDWQECQWSSCAAQRLSTNPVKETCIYCSEKYNPDLYNKVIDFNKWCIFFDGKLDILLAWSQDTYLKMYTELDFVNMLKIIIYLYVKQIHIQVTI